MAEEEMHPLKRIAYEAFEQGAARQRARRAAAGLAPVSSDKDFKATQALWRGVLEAIPFGRGGEMPPDWDDRKQTVDGGPWCDACEGIRWVVDGSDPDATFRGLVPCTVCAPLLLPLRRDRLAEQAGLHDHLRSQTFIAFRPVAGTEFAFKAALDFTRKPQGWLHLFGRPGTGKTHLACAIANELVQQLHPVRWWYVADMTLHAKELIGRGDGAVDAFRRSLEATPVLVLDDLGSAKATGWAIQEFLEPLINHRYNLRRPTIFTTIGNAQEVRDHLSESIGRRMQDEGLCRSVENTADQWRGER